MPYTMGEFADLTGLPPHTLRYYEDLGILTPARTGAGRRTYSEQDLAWMQFVRRLKDTGMPVKQIVRYSDLRREGDSTTEERLRMLEEHRIALLGRIEALCAERDRLEEKIALYRGLLDPNRPG